MTTERRNEIAFRALVKKWADEKHIPNLQNLKRDLPNEVKKYGITLAEGEEFMHEFVPHVIAACLGVTVEKVSIKWS